jgi:ribosomal protein S18 acetylase RimI-like enzyme
MMPAVNLRTATADDAPALLARMAEGFESYRGFAPEGWEPPMPTTEMMRGRIMSPSAWTLVAEDGGLAGHVAFLGSEESGHPEPDPALAHLWQLFVRPRDWGTGTATDLLARAVAEARARGFTEMRLFTPSGQARARRFYEREGWTAVREFDDPRLGLAVVEYRRAT